MCSGRSEADLLRSVALQLQTLTEPARGSTPSERCRRPLGDLHPAPRRNVSTAGAHPQYDDIDIANAITGITDGHKSGLNLVHLNSDLNFDAYRHRKDRPARQQWRGMLGQSGTYKERTFETSFSMLIGKQRTNRTATASNTRQQIASHGKKKGPSKIAGTNPKRSHGKVTAPSTEIAHGGLAKKRSKGEVPKEQMVLF